MPRPSGTLTFLSTDIEGSTRLWDQQPEGMQRALSRHDAMLHEVIREHGGRVLNTVGDSFSAAFPDPPSAVAAALDAQRRFRAEPWDEAVELRVRIALHTGPAYERHGDYVGAVVNRLAGLLVCGHGGQTLVSQSTYDLSQQHLPGGVTFRDLGEHRLRDLSRPERIFQLVHPDLPRDFPPLRSLQAFAHNLPVQMTSFIGREAEIEQVRQLLAQTRLLTLTGVGGGGKTRLALQAGAELLAEHSHGVWLAELAPFDKPGLVPQTIAEAIGVRDEADQPIVETLVDHLRPNECLLILDNCEHLLAGCARVADELLRNCPRLKILASSREPLMIAGETVYHLRSLSVPDVCDTATAEAISPYEAVRLFVDRAQSHQPDFDLDDRNAPVVAQICRRLDGIPLAIELAAARCRAMPVEMIAARLDDRFSLLADDSRAALPRQQTLRALLDWSHDLLDEREKMLFRRLAVFVDGWTLEAAESVCGGRGLAKAEVLEVLASLVTKSVALYEELGSGCRYRLLETIRLYARDRLSEAGELARFCDRHRGFFIALAEQARDGMGGPQQAGWFERLEAEHRNMRAALEWCQRTPAGAGPGLRLARALSLFWGTRGHVSEGRQRMADALAHAGGVPAVDRAYGLTVAGWLARRHGDFRAARAYFDDSLAIFRQADRQRGVVSCLDGLGHVALAEGDYQEAEGLFQESLTVRRRLASEAFVAAGLQSLGLVAWLQGDCGTAQGRLNESLGIWRKLGNKRKVAQCLSRLGLVAATREAYAEARGLQEESLAIHRELGHREGIAGNVERLAGLHAAEGRPRRAARLLGAAEALRETVEAPRNPILNDVHQQSVSRARAALGDEAFETAWAEGRSMALDEAVASALGEREA